MNLQIDGRESKNQYISMQIHKPNMMIDEESRRKQIWVAARMTATERSATTVYFPALPLVGSWKRGNKLGLVGSWKWAMLRQHGMIRTLKIKMPDLDVRRLYGKKAT